VVEPRRHVAAVVGRVLIVGLSLASAAHVGLDGLAHLAGLELDAVWGAASGALGVVDPVLRLALFAPLHVALLAPRRWRRVDELVLTAWTHLDDTAPAVRGVVVGTSAFSAGILALALVVQPTLVPWRVDLDTSLVRLANLADGTAPASLAGSLVGLWRRGTAAPVGADLVVDAATFGLGLDAPSVPLIDRWDPLLLAAADGDAALAAETKAFLWVESGGRQFAVSSTGCLGLLQFCTTTAERRPFDRIFGVGRVTACACDGCAIPRTLQVELETDPQASLRRPPEFPCDLADARFDPERSIRAGVAYVRELRAATGGELLLMYVGYNSGPRVAAALRKKLPADAPVTVEALRPVLASALRPWYGAGAEARARGLLDVHLPKLQAAWERWRPAHPP
jgi:hypothetical protein